MSDSISIPRYQLHRATGRARVTLNGRDVYLGEHNSPDSKAKYQRLIAEWLSAGRTLAPSGAGAALSVSEVMLAYVRHAESYYRDADGNPTREVWRW